MVSWVDIAPTVLDWAGVKAPPRRQRWGRSFLPILEQENPKGWDVVYGSHQCHEITMYYPMRMIRTRTHKYILNLAHPLEFPCAGDLYDSPTWQGILKRGDKMLGLRGLDAFLHRPREELYDLEKDPDELKNVAADPNYAEVLADLRTPAEGVAGEDEGPVGGQVPARVTPAACEKNRGPCLSPSPTPHDGEVSSAAFEPDEPIPRPPARASRC